MFLYIPLVVSLCAVGYFWFMTEMDLKWKLAATVIVALSLCFQFVPAMRQHFLIPVVMQSFVGIWMVFHQKMS